MFVYLVTSNVYEPSIFRQLMALHLFTFLNLRRISGHLFAVSAGLPGDAVVTSYV